MWPKTSGKFPYTVLIVSSSPRSDMFLADFDLVKAFPNQPFELPSLTRLTFRLAAGSSSDQAACPPIFASIPDGYLSHPAFREIEELEIIATCHFDSIPYRIPSDTPLVDPTTGGWDALDNRLVALPNIRVLKVNLGIEDGLSSAIGAGSRQSYNHATFDLLKQTQGVMDGLFPGLRANGVAPMVKCHIG